MKGVNYNVAILSDQALRADSLAKIIENGFNHRLKVPVFTTEDIGSLNNLLNPLLLLMDLMGTNKSSRQLILPIKEKNSEIKIIALHLYRSTILVNPLFSMGIDGYVYYEPSRNELVKAIQTVMTGKKYIPKNLLSA